MIALTLAAAVLGALPLLVIEHNELLRQYRWWSDIERNNAQDLMFGLSLMRQFRDWWEVGWPNWSVQAIGTMVFLAPLALRRDRWGDEPFREGRLCSLLIFVTIFNHQAERQSFVIAATGCAIWFVGNRRGTRCSHHAGHHRRSYRTYLIVWLVIQPELLTDASAVAQLSAAISDQASSRSESGWKLPRPYSRAS